MRLEKNFEVIKRIFFNFTDDSGHLPLASLKMNICTPSYEVVCEDAALPIKMIEDIPYTFTSNRTYCSTSIDVVPNEVCTYYLEEITEDTVMRSVDIKFENEKAIVTPIDVPVTVSYKNWGKTCIDEPIILPVITCADISEELTQIIPSITDSAISVEVCTTEVKHNCQVLSDDYFKISKH